MMCAAMTESLPQSSEELAPALDGLPAGVRLSICGNACLRAARERRTQRALFFSLASLAVGFTVSGGLGALVCGIFGGSLYLVVLLLRMQRHLRSGSEEYRAAQKTSDD